MKKNAKSFITFLITAFILFSILSVPAFAAAEVPSVTAKRILMADLDADYIFYSVNADELVHPASLTKIMTLLLAVEAVENSTVSLQDNVTAYDDCRQGLEEDSSTQNIVPGEIMSFQNLMYCAMLGSANEACNIIGEYISGSISGFVDLMNQRAARLGCANTHFANTNGLTDPAHYTTASDLYIITKEALRHDLFVEMCNKKTLIVPATNVSGERSLANSNALINPSGIYGPDYIYEPAKGVKTGYTYAAGYCLVSTAEKGGNRVCCIVLGCDGPLNVGAEEYNNFVDSIALYKWVFSNFSKQTVISAADTLAVSQAALASGTGTVTLKTGKDIKLLLPNDTENLPDHVTVTTRVYEDMMTAPISSGTVLGEADIYIDGSYCGTVDLVTPVSIELSKSAFIKQRLSETMNRTWVKAVIVIIVIFFVLYLFLVARYRTLRRRHLREKAAAEEKRRAAFEERARAAREQAKQRVSVSDETRRISSEKAPRVPRAQSFEEIMKEFKDYSDEK
ncbi:MAG: D-alanyl-D-alanine carboxypeptidase [Oscillospiraceae bacterium]|nr:D-alanyl-D-alanine carboxypeptidase [Oscillospiraceae bacterium]